MTRSTILIWVYNANNYLLLLMRTRCIELHQSVGLHSLISLSKLMSWQFSSGGVVYWIGYLLLWWETWFVYLMGRVSLVFYFQIFGIVVKGGEKHAKNYFICLILGEFCWRCFLSLHWLVFTFICCHQCQWGRLLDIVVARICCCHWCQHIHASVIADWFIGILVWCMEYL